MDPASLTWTARLTDDATLTEDEAGGFLPVMAAHAEGRLDSVCVRTHDGMPVAQVVIRDGMRPIFGRLWLHRLSPDGTDHGRALRAVVYGWQKTVNGRSVKALTWVTAGGVFVADRDLDDIEAGG
jgi:hypothetical protein